MDQIRLNPGRDAESESATGGGDGESHDNVVLVPDWRQQIEEQCRSWLDSLEETPPESRPETETEAEIPDIYSFYAELCATRHEFRKQSRRTTDVLSRFGGMLDELEVVFARLPARLDRADELERQVEDLELKRGFFLPLVDMYDRFQRLEKRLADPPRTGFWGAGRHWRRSWDSLGDGFAILGDHFAALLRQAGVETLDAVGRPFDPRTMKVVEVEETDAIPADEVLAELATGYLYRGQVLRLAAVKVAKNKKKEETK